MRKKMLSILTISLLLTGCQSDINTTETIVIDRELNLSGENPISFPLDEPLELTFHYHASNQYAFNESWPVFKEMEQLTNISFKNTANTFSTQTATEMQLQTASQFPSDLYGGSNISNYFMTYGPDGAFYSLDDYWEYLPNFSQYLSENPDVIASITSPDGKIYHLPSLTDGGVSRAYFIREDWLDNLGLDMPETVEEFENTLIAFKNDDPNGNGIKDEIPYFNDNWLEMIRLVNLWDARCYSSDNYDDRFVRDEYGVWYHTWTTDEFKEGIKNISRWYDLGLIDRQIFTIETSARLEYLIGDLGGMTHEWVSSTSTYNNNSYVDNFKFSVVSPPITANGNQWEEHVRTKVTDDGVAISTSCDEEIVPLLFAYLDYFWSEEGRILANYGVEDEHWTYIDGFPTFKEEIVDDSPSVYTYLRENVGAQLNFGFVQDYNYELQWTHPLGIEGAYMYTQNGYSDNLFTLPNLPYTSDELYYLDTLLYGIHGYQNEQIVTFILEDWMLIDSAWDKYVEKSELLGVPDLLNLVDTVYTRYISYQY